MAREASLKEWRWGLAYNEQEHESGRERRASKEEESLKEGFTRRGRSSFSSRPALVVGEAEASVGSRELKERGRLGLFLVGDEGEGGGDSGEDWQVWGEVSARREKGRRNGPIFVGNVFLGSELRTSLKKEKGEKDSEEDGEEESEEGVGGEERMASSRGKIC